MTKLKPQIRLRCISTTHSSIKQTESVIRCHNDEYTSKILVSHINERHFELCKQTEHSPKSGVLAKFQAQDGINLALEPLVNEITVEPGLPDWMKDKYEVDRLLLPPHEAGKHYLVFVRPGDTVHFESHGLSISILVEDFAKDTGAVPWVARSHDKISRLTTEGSECQDDEVQVKSSSADMEITDDRLLGYDFLEGSQADGKRAEDFTVERTVFRTPVKSRQLAQPQSFINETSNQLSTQLEEPRYSTAPSVPYFGSETTGHQGKLEGSHAECATQISRLKHLDYPIGASMENDPGTTSDRNVQVLVSGASSGDTDSFEDDFFKPHGFKRTYGKQGKSAGMASSGSDAPFDGDDGDVTQDQVDRADQVDFNSNTHPSTPTKKLKLTQSWLQSIPENVSELSISHQAMEQAVVTRLGKRKSNEEKDLSEATNFQLKRNKQEKFSEKEAYEGTRDDSDVQNPKFSRSGINQGRYPKLSPTTNGSASLEEIAISPGVPRRMRTSLSSSPQVVIQTNGNAETPTSPKGSLSQRGISKILLSGTKISKPIENWLKSKGVQIVEDIPSRHCPFVCVVQKGELKNTIKVLRTLALDKSVVTQDWLNESRKADVILDVTNFMHEDVRNGDGRKRQLLFAGKDLYFTDALIQQYGTTAWSNIKTIASNTGARFVGHGDDEKNGPIGSNEGLEDALFFGCHSGDYDATSLILNFHRTVWHRDFFTDTIVSGKLDLDNRKHKLNTAYAKPRRRRGRF